MCKCLNKFEQSRRQFLRTASLATMSGLYASPMILGLNSLAAMAQGTGAIGLSRAGLRVSAGRQRRPRHGDCHRRRFVFSVHAGALGSSGAGVSAVEPAADRAEHAAERAHFCAESVSGRDAESVQRGAGGGCRQHGNADCSGDQGAGAGEFGAAAGFAVLALRSDGGVAGDCLEWRQRGARGLGRRGGGPDREHEDELELDVHVHLDGGDCAVSRRGRRRSSST